MKNILKNILSVIVGVVVFLIAFYVVAIVIGFIAKIPILRTILYWPSDAPWASMVLPPIAATSAGSFVSTLICGNAKAFSGVIIVLYVINFILALLNSLFTWALLITTIVVVIAASICFTATRGDF